MSLYSGDEDSGDEITSPDCEVLYAPANSFDAFVRRCSSDSINRTPLRRDLLDVDATGKGRLKGRATPLGSLPASPPATSAPEGAAASRGMAEATKPGPRP